MPERIRGVTLPTWALGLIVALLTFSVSFGAPAPGLDASWGAGLYMAVHEGLSFGTDVVYTYGPLGFLYSPVLWFDGLAVISFLYSVALWVALATAIVWSIRRTLGTIAALLIAFLVLALFTALEAALAISVIWAFALLVPDRPRWALEALVVGGAIFAAIEILLKLSIGPVILVVMVLALIGARARLWQIGLFAGIFVIATLALWLVSGSAFGDLADYFANGREIVSGYSEALALPVGAGWQKAIALAIVFLLAAAAALATYRDGRARLCGIAIAAIAGFAMYKEGVVRSDEGHMTVALATMVAIWLSIPPPRARAAVFVGGLVMLSAIALKVQPGVGTDRLNPINNLQLAKDQGEMLFSPTRREDVRTYLRLIMTEIYGLGDRQLAQLQGRTVSVEPWEIAAAWVYGLDWSPAPVFQNYQAYTSDLDDLNAEVIASPAGPERILLENPVTEGDLPGRGVDNHFSSWDPPAQALATLCNFEVLSTSERWQVLGRVPDRCGEPRLVGSVESAYGEEVPVPAAGPGEVVFARIDGAAVEGVEKLRTLLYRAEFRYATVDGVSYRLVPGTAADGLLLNGSPKLTGSGVWSWTPQAETIELTGPDGDLRYDFFAMSVEQTGEAGTDRKRGA